MVLCSSLVAPLHAQLATGTINGFVKDPTGATIPGAKVTAKMVEQQAVRETQTNADGFYTFPAMPPGSYEITFEAGGFKREVRTGLELTVGQNLRVDTSLEVGAPDTEVTIAATAPLVDTTSPTLSGLIDDRRVVDLPLNGRNVIGLARILPGVLGVSARPASSSVAITASGTASSTRLPRRRRRRRPPCRSVYGISGACQAAP